MNRKISISIGIVAYNEEANIKKLIQRLLLQQHGFKIAEIIVVSDGSDDRTVREVKSLKGIVKIVRHSNRIGKSLRENELLKIYKGNYLLILDADILPDKHLLKNIIISIQNTKKFGIIGCKVIPLTANTLFEKIINSSVTAKQKIYEKINNGNNVYLCHGRARVFSRPFTAKLKWEAGVSEDAYSYLACTQLGHTFIYEPKAKVYYRSPQNLSDHVKQSARFFQGKNDMRRIFNKRLVDKSYFIPKRLILAGFLSYLIKTPVLFTSYIFILIISKFSSTKGAKHLASWDQSTTSKNLMPF